MKHEDLIAIDIHTHAEVSCRNPFDNYGEEYDRAADKYFGSNRRPTIAETVAYYRERKVGLVMFTVDSESNMGRRRIPNEEIADAARENSDMMIAFASIDPHKGKMGAREAERLIKEAGVKGFKFHPTVQGFHPYDRMGLADLRGDQPLQAAGDLPHRPQRHRVRHAVRRRPAPRIQQPHAPR
jgi:predicted TIM-barrel fold metal-dependent hydrolase